jgi:hypothetical protein
MVEFTDRTVKIVDGRLDLDGPSSEVAPQDDMTST